MSHTPLPAMWLIEWLDASGSTGWCEEDDFVPPHQNYSLGFIVKQDKDFVYIAADWAGGGEGVTGGRIMQWGHPKAIPRAAIKQKVKLVEAKK